MEGTVSEAKREVLALDWAGGTDDESLISGRAIFDAMTMGCFKFNSSGDGDDLEAVLVFCGALTNLTALTSLAGTGTALAFLTFFLSGAATVSTGFCGLLAALFAGMFVTLTAVFTGTLTGTFAGTFGIGFGRGFGRGFAATFTTGVAVFLMIAFGDCLVAVFTAGFATPLMDLVTLLTGFSANLGVGFTGFTVFFAAAFVTTLAAALLGVFVAAFEGAFLTAFFATVFIHCLPAKLVFIQIKQSTHTHQKTDALALKPLRIYLHFTVTGIYINNAKNQSARGL